MSSPNRKEITFCPECDSRIKLRSPRPGQRVTCHACGTGLEVIELSPLELDWAFSDDYDDFDYDDRLNGSTEGYGDLSYEDDL